MDFRKGPNTVESVETVSRALNRDENARVLLQDLPRAQHTEINDARMTALSDALTQWTGLTSSWIELEGHGREQVFESLDVSTDHWLVHKCVSCSFEKRGTRDGARCVRD